MCVGCGQQVSCGNIVCQSAPLAAWLVGCLVVHGFRGLQMLSAVKQAMLRPECSCCLLKLCLFTVVSVLIRSC